VQREIQIGIPTTARVERCLRKCDAQVGNTVTPTTQWERASRRESRVTRPRTIHDEVYLGSRVDRLKYRQRRRGTIAIDAA
jgi:hypothetical protein